MKTKNLFSMFVFIMAALGCMLVPIRSWAYNIEVDGIYYDIDLVMRATVAKGPYQQNEVIIPSTFEYEGNTYQVLSIGDHAFQNRTNLTSVTIPESVTSIGAYSFAESGLTSIIIPDCVTSIGKGAFMQCRSLQSVKLSCNLTKIEYLAFCDCESLTSLNIPDGVKLINTDAFASCRNLTTLDMGNTLTGIGPSAFLNCYNLQHVSFSDNLIEICEFAFQGCSQLNTLSLPDGLTTIGQYAFSICGLTSIAIGSGVKSIGSHCFSGNPDLETIVVNEGNTTYDSRDNCNALIQTQYNRLIRGCKNTVIPASVQSVEEWAFSDCNGLSMVVIPESVGWVGVCAFYYIPSLEIVYVNGPVKFENSAFEEDENIRLFVVDSRNPPKIGNSFVDESIFQNAEVQVPLGCKSIYENATGWRKFIHIVENENLEGGSGISSVMCDPDGSKFAPYYDVSGRRVEQPQRGTIYIRQGRKEAF